MTPIEPTSSVPPVQAQAVTPVPPILPTAPITMTAAQYQAKFGTPPMAPTSNGPVTMTAAQYQEKYGVAPIAPYQPNALERFSNFLANSAPAKAMLNIAQSGADQAVTGFKNAGNDLNQDDYFKSLEDVTSGLVGGVEAGTSGFAAPFIPMGEGVKNFADVVSQNPELQKFASSPVGIWVSRIAQDISNVNALMGTVAGFQVPGEIKGTLKNPEVLPIEENGEVPPGSPPLEKSPQQDMVATELQKVSKDWTAPTEDPSAKFDNARTILAENPGVGNTLASLGKNPFDHLTEDGKFDTQSTADSIRNQNAVDSRTLIRPGLVAAEASVPAMPAQELLQPAIDSLNEEPNITPTLKIKITKIIRGMVNDTEEVHPEGLKLSTMMDERIAHDGNAGYSAIKSNADNNVAIANRALGNAYRTELIQRAPPELGIDNFQKTLSDRYRAADYIESLDGKKAPVSIARQVARYVAKIAGARAAKIFGGSDLIGEIVGYRIGGSLERFVENMTNPMRDAFLKDIKLKNPEAFERVKAYIDTIEQNAKTIIKLPPAPPIGEPGNPIITPIPKLVTPDFTAIPAKAISIKDPKTGKFDKAFTSEGKGKT